MPLKTFTSGEVLTAGDVNLYLANVVIQANSTSITTPFSTSSTSFVDVTGLSVSITPKATTSKILVMVSGVAATSTTGLTARINLNRDSTAIGQSTGGTSNQSATIYTNSAAISDGFAISYLDSPASTSAITYKVQLAAGGAVTAYLGRYGTGATSPSITTITVMEISQ